LSAPAPCALAKDEDYQKDHSIGPGRKACRHQNAKTSKKKRQARDLAF
jgi:hypothetical protein